MNGIQEKFEQAYKNDCLLKETQCSKNVVHYKAELQSYLQ